MSGTWPTRHEWLRKVVRRLEPYDYVRTGVGLLLLTAAAFKIHELRTRPVLSSLETGLLSARWVQIAVVDVELFLGVCLLFGQWRQFVWAATLLLFVVFAGVSLFTFAAGADTCGCFGAAEVDPMWSLLLDQRNRT